LREYVVFRVTIINKISALQASEFMNLKKEEKKECARVRVYRPLGLPALALEAQERPKAASMAEGHTRRAASGSKKEGSAKGAIWKKPTAQPMGETRQSRERQP
jgi:hypothetical protein